MQGVWITPAHAGNSPWPSSRNVLPRDHPRACGEQSKGKDCLVYLRGSPPRMRGTAFGVTSVWGRVRITPAHAGNSDAGAGEFERLQDHPRACGEQILSLSRQSTLTGSPPRMRGTGHCENGSQYHARITPAHAGNSTLHGMPQRSLGDHPRACGEQSLPDDLTAEERGSPPRMRGTATWLATTMTKPRITPAHAGNSEIR